MKKKIVTSLIVIAVVAGLLLTAHILVNYFDLPSLVRGIHGG